MSITTIIAEREADWEAEFGSSDGHDFVETIRVSALKSHTHQTIIAVIEEVRKSVEFRHIEPVSNPHGSPYISGVNDTVGKIVKTIDSTLTSLREIDNK